MSATITPDLIQRIADAEAWQSYAARMNQRALDAGLITEVELAPARKAAEAALARLRGRIG